MRRPVTTLARFRRPFAYGAVWLLRMAAFTLLFLPIALVVYLSFGSDPYTVIPPSGYSLSWYANAFERGEFVSGLVTSLSVASIATPTSVVIGTLSAYGLWRFPGGTARALESLLMLPVLLPLVVTGLALLVFFNRMQFYGGFWNIVIAHVIITFPYSFRAVMAALSRYDRQLDEAAASLGSSPWTTFRHVTLPMIRPGLFAGGLFAFVMSFDDFAVTIFLISPGMSTLPVAIYQYMEWNLDPTVSAVSAMLILMAVAGTLIIERFIGMDRFIGLRG